MTCWCKLIGKCEVLCRRAERGTGSKQTQLTANSVLESVVNHCGCVQLNQLEMTGLVSPHSMTVSVCTFIQSYAH